MATHQSWKQAHLNAMFKEGDHGTVDVSCGAVSFTGLERRGTDQPFEDPLVEADSWIVTVPTHIFGGVALVGADITIDGVPATILRRVPKDDGSTLDLYLSEA